RRLGLHGAGRQGIDHEHVAVAQLLRERGAQGALLDLLRELVVVAPRLRPEGGAALAPEGIADFTDARAAGALLPPRLLAAAAHVRAGLRRVRAAALAGVLPRHRLPDEIGLHAPAEHLVAHFEGADLLVLRIDYVYSHRRCSLALGFGLWACSPQSPEPRAHSPSCL